LNKRIVAIGMVSLAFYVPDVVRGDGDAEQELIRIETAWRKARVEGDVAFLESLYAKELRIAGTDGSVIERGTDISLFASGKIRPEFIKAEDMRVSLYSDVAVVTGSDHLKGSYKGAQREGRVRFTHVFVRREGRWQLVASQGTWVQEKE
jgi:ketosteroid isomerase-like protein